MPYPRIMGQKPGGIFIDSVIESVKICSLLQFLTLGNALQAVRLLKFSPEGVVSNSKFKSFSPYIIDHKQTPRNLGE
jgi:hypothetical protein